MIRSASKEEVLAYHVNLVNRVQTVLLSTSHFRDDGVGEFGGPRSAAYVASANFAFGEDF